VIRAFFIEKARKLKSCLWLVVAYGSERKSEKLKLEKRKSWKAEIRKTIHFKNGKAEKLKSDILKA
jgi:hypothetical protein